MASSQVISFQPGSTPMPFSGLVRLSGFFTRLGWCTSSARTMPLAQMYPFEFAASGSPLTSTILPSTRCTRMPQQL